MSEENRQIKYGAMISYLAIILNSVISLAYTPWMANQLGKSQYGLYNLAYSFVRMFLVDLGLNAAVSRFVAKYRAEGREDKVEHFLGTVTKFYLVLGAIICAILIVVYFFLGDIYQGLTAEEIVIFRKIYLIMAAATVFSFPFLSQNGILTAYAEFIPLKLCDLGQKVLSVILIIIALLNHMDVVAVMAAYAGSTIVFILVKYFIIRNGLHLRIISQKNDQEMRTQILQFTAWTATTTIAEGCTYGLAPTILGIVSNTAQIALFSPANFLEGYFSTFAAAINDMFLPRISRYIAQGKENRIYPLMVMVGRYQLAFMGLIFIGFLCVGNTFMVTWMGPDYQGAYLCTVLCIIPDMLNVTQQIANTAVIAENKVRQKGIAQIVKTIVCISLSFLLSSKFGALGACMAISIAALTEFAMMNRVYQKELNLDIRSFFRECYRSFLIPDAISLVAGYYLCNVVLAGVGWKYVIIQATAVVLIYSLSVWLMALKPEEKAYLKQKLFHK